MKRARSQESRLSSSQHKGDDHQSQQSVVKYVFDVAGGEAGTGGGKRSSTGNRVQLEMQGKRNNKSASGLKHYEFDLDDPIGLTDHESDGL